MKVSSIYFILVSVLFLVSSANGQEITPIGDINAVDEEGNAIFAGLQTMDQYTIEGIALNDPGIYWGGEGERSDFILYVQDDTGGIQVYSGGWYGGGIESYADTPVQQGDRVRVTGLTGHYGGKTNVNERHNPDQKFVIENLGYVGDPEPLIIEDLTAASQFDSTRQTGGEYYQGRLVKLMNVQIVDGEWGSGAMLTVADSMGGTLPVELRVSTGIGDYSAPEGTFDVVGVFNQEDPEAPHIDNYLLWPRSIEDFGLEASSADDWDLYK